MHRLSSSFVLAFHGCSREVGKAVLGGAEFKPSENRWDWLGSGIYFWETNPKRALEWAVLLSARKKLHTEYVPFVVGAAIDLGYCLDLVAANGIAAVSAAHRDLDTWTIALGEVMPRNEGADDDLLLRNLDCAVINHLHKIQAIAGQPAFDTVRGVFLEGARLYEGSGFYRKTHVQICVRNPKAIHGVFRVRPEDLE